MQVDPERNLPWALSKFHLSWERPRQWINSGGLGLLVQLTARANSQGGRVVVSAPSPFVADVLETTRLNRFFDVAANTDDAVARLSAKSIPASSI